MSGISNSSRENYTPTKIKFIKELQAMINVWIQDNPVRSVASLARAAKVSDVSIRRLLNNDRKIVNESVFNIISLISGQDTFEGIVEALEKDNKPTVQEWFIKYYSYMRNFSDVHDFKRIPVVDMVAANPMAFFVYSLTLIFDQVSQGQFEQEFGGPAMTELDKLIKKGFLQEKEGMIGLPGEKAFLRFTKEQMAYLFSEVSRLFFKPDHKFNAQHLEVGSLSKEGYGELIDLHAEFINGIHHLYETKPGNIPVISAGFTDTLTSRPYFTDEGKNHRNPQKDQS